MRISGAFLAFLILVACSELRGGDTFQAGDVYNGTDSRPWTHLDFANDPANFQFVVITDRTGGHRPGVFPAILKKVNLMQPELVMSVGDYIEGYTEEVDQLLGEWAEIDGWVGGLDAPLFFIVGNHDLSNKTMEKLWIERAGRTYYSFRYKDVLFVALNTEDEIEMTPEERAAFEEGSRIAKTDYDAALRFSQENDLIRNYMASHEAGIVGDIQRDWALDVLAKNKGVRWTFFFMHKPLWKHENANFMNIEEALRGRGYTMFAGHIHSYEYTRRNGRDHMQLGTTGGGWSGPDNKKVGEMDHITWVTMRNADEGGPVFAHLVATGILEKDGVPDFVPGAEFCGKHYNIACVYTKGD